MKDYTEEDICKIYRNADENQDRIKLIQELTLYRKETIIDILEKYGYEVKKKKERKLTKEEFLTYYELGISDRQIALKFKVCEGTVSRLRNQLRLPPNNTNIQKKIRFVELLNNGVSLQEIALELKVSIYTIRNWNKELQAAD